MIYHLLMGLSGSENQKNYQSVQTGVDRLRQKFNQDRLKLIGSKFPEIVQDAQRFMETTFQSTGAFYRPWEYFNVAADKDPAEEIQEKYKVGWSRRRPTRDQILPETDLFYEVSDIVFDERTAELRAKIIEDSGENTG